MLQKRYNNFFILIIVLIGFIIYAHTFWFSYTPLDDYELYIKKTDWLQNLLNIPALFTGSIDDSVSSPFYRPVLMLSFMIDSFLGKGNLFYFHFTNLVIHVCVAILIFYLFNIVFKSGKTAFFWAALFLVHPVNVHAVTWIPGRNDTLLTLFSLAAVLSLFKYIETNRNRWLLVNFITFLLAMYTKEQGVLLMFIFGLVIFQSRLRTQLMPMSFIWFITCFMFIIPRKFVMTGGWIFNITDYFTYFLNVLKAFVISVGKVIFPVYQSVLPSVSDTPLWPGIIVIFLICLAIYFKGIRNMKVFVLGLFWFLIMAILPLLWGSLVDEHFEHRLYLSSIGLFLLVSQLNIFSILTKEHPRWSMALVIVILITFGMKTWWRTYAYRDEISYALAAVNESPHHYRTYYLLGNVYKSEGEWQSAITAYDRAIELNAKISDIFNNRGDTFLKLKVFDKALEDFDAALAISPDNLSVRNNRAVALFFMQEYDLAWDDVCIVLEKGGKVHPDFLEALTEKHLSNR